MNITIGEANSVVRRSVSQANKVDQTLDEWEDRLVKLGTEYGQELSAKVKTAVSYGMMPKDLQDKVFDICAVNWD